MAAFDNYEGGSEHRPMWILHLDGFSDFVQVDDIVVGGQHFAVNVEGVARRGCLPEGYVCFEELLLPSSGRLSLTMKRVVDGREWRIEVNDSEVISDAQLKEWGYR